MIISIIKCEMNYLSIPNSNGAAIECCKWISNFIINLFWWKGPLIWMGSRLRELNCIWTFRCITRPHVPTACTINVKHLFSTITWECVGTIFRGKCNLFQLLFIWSNSDETRPRIWILILTTPHHHPPHRSHYVCFVWKVDLSALWYEL